MTQGASGRLAAQGERTFSASQSPRRAKRRAAGQGLVEFALVLPVLMLMLVMVIDFGRVFLSYIALNNATRVAANFGSVNPDSFTGTPKTTTYNAVVNADAASLSSTCPIRKDAANYNPPLPTYPSGTGLAAVSQVAFTCDFKFLTPLMNNFFGGSLAITASAQFPVRTGALANIGGTTTLPPPGAPVAAFKFVGVSGGTVDSGTGNVTGVSPVTVNFQDLSVNAQTWSWDFGDLAPLYEADGAPPTHQYTADSTRTFSVTLTVSNTVGSSSVTHTVTVDPAVTTPVAGFYGTPIGSAPQAVGGGSGGAAISGTRGLQVNYTNTSTGANAYSWDYGDGTAASTTASPSHSYAALGIYTVVLSVTDPTGVSPVTRSNYVTVGCVVPNFANTNTGDAQSTWTLAGFTGTITYQKKNGSSSITPPSPSKKIDSQTSSASTPTFQSAGGAFDAPVQVSGTWRCTGDITLVYP